MDKTLPCKRIKSASCILSSFFRTFFSYYFWLLLGFSLKKRFSINEGKIKFKTFFIGKKYIYPPLWLSVNTAVVKISSRADFEKVLSEYLEWRKQFTDETGELLERYQMAPMVASFMEEEDAFQAKQRKEIGVPKGPVEVW